MTTVSTPNPAHPDQAPSQVRPVPTSVNIYRFPDGSYRRVTVMSDNSILQMRVFPGDYADAPEAPEEFHFLP